MGNKWDRMTRQSWDSSEVMKEFESLVLKESAKIRRQAGVIDSAEKAEESLESAEQSAKELLSTVGETSFAEDESPAVDDEDYRIAKDQLLEELHTMAAQAVNEGNIKLAYKIERAIDEIKEEA